MKGLMFLSIKSVIIDTSKFHLEFKDIKMVPCFLIFKLFFMSLIGTLMISGLFVSIVDEKGLV